MDWIPIEWILGSATEKGEALVVRTAPKAKGGGHGVGAAVGEGGTSSAGDGGEGRRPWEDVVVRVAR